MKVAAAFLFVQAHGEANREAMQLRRCVCQSGTLNEIKTKSQIEFSGIDVQAHGEANLPASQI